MCTLAVREHSPGIRIIGYQHAVVPEAALNMFLHPQDAGVVPLPDRILTVGEVTAGLLRKYGNYPPGVLHTACALRYEYFKQAKADPLPWRGHVLVVLDGVSQSAHLLEYVLAQFNAQTPWDIVLRAHPALPRSYWQKHYGQQISWRTRIKWSDQSLHQDLDWADAVVYWQSTVAWEALSRGRAVVNFATRDILSYDPLLNCPFLRWSVTVDNSLFDVLGHIRGLSPEVKMEQYRQARDMIEQCFYPVSDQGLKSFF